MPDARCLRLASALLALLLAASAPAMAREPAAGPDPSAEPAPPTPTATPPDALGAARIAVVGASHDGSGALGWPEPEPVRRHAAWLAAVAAAAVVGLAIALLREPR